MISIPYLDREISLDLPAESILFDKSPQAVPPASDPEKKIMEAIAHPIATPPLSSLVHPAQQVVIIVDDNTRLTPIKKILPVVLDELNRAGISDRNIQAVIATGTHRHMTTQEKEEKFGAALLSRIRFLNHHHKDPNKLVDYGMTARGTRIFVNKDVVQADFRIALGNIIPHYPTGWSAGAKAVLPGVAGEETVAQMHFLGCKKPALGEVDTPMRNEMEEYAAKIGLHFIVNVVLNREGKIVDAVAGHFIQAHRKGVEIAKSVYGVTIPAQADLVISSATPIDFDLFQADKGIMSAEPATKEGGEIVLVSGCVEGISPAHPELADYLGRMTNQQIWDLVNHKDLPDPLTVAEAIMLNDIKAKRKITIATNGLSPELCHQMDFGHVSPDRLGKYVLGQSKANGKPTIGILRNSAELFPFVEPNS